MLEKQLSALWTLLELYAAEQRYDVCLTLLRVISPLLALLKLDNDQLSWLVELFSKIDAQASEKTFRDYLHKKFFEKLSKQFNSEQVNFFQKLIQTKLPHSAQARIPYESFEYTFKTLCPSDVHAQQTQFLKERGQWISRLEATRLGNFPVVLSEWILSFLKALQIAGQTVSDAQLNQLAHLLEQLLSTATNNETLRPEALHYFFVGQRILEDFLASHLPWSNAKTLEQYQALSAQSQSSLVLQHQLLWRLGTHLSQLNPQTDTGLLESLLGFANQRAVTFRRPSTTKKVDVLQDCRSLLKDSRALFLHACVQQAQAHCTQQSLALLNHFLNSAIKLLGEPPFEFALCALGSTSRYDRRPYSDVELMLLYQPKSGFKTEYLQTYLYRLIMGLELQIIGLGETHYQTQAIMSDAGFHLDSSSHFLLKNLFDTPEKLAARFVLNLLQDPQHQSHAKYHAWLDDESLYSLLNPMLVNTHAWGGEALLLDYKNKILDFLNHEACLVEDELNELQKRLRLNDHFWQRGNLPRRRHIIAISTWWDVLQKSVQALDEYHRSSSAASSSNNQHKIDLKRAFYKPLTYLSLTLKLFYGWDNAHPQVLLKQIPTLLTWGGEKLSELLVTALDFVVNRQVQLHLKSGYQEEEIDLQAEDPLIKPLWDLLEQGLIRPLHKQCKNHLKDLLNPDEHIQKQQWQGLLWKTYKDYLKLRENWFRHHQRSNHFNEIILQPLLQKFWQEPAENGWFPAAQQGLSTWFSQLSVLMRAEKSDCVVEGIPLPSTNTAASGQCYLPDQLVKTLFDSKGKLQGDAKYSSEQSQVKRLEINGRTVYLKVKPGNKEGLMGREYAVEHLHRLLGGECQVAAGWPVKLTHIPSQQICYAWISEAVEGQSLADQMRADPKLGVFSEFLTPENFTQLFLLAYLTYPEDGQPENFQLVPTTEGRMRLVSLDNGQSFVAPKRQQNKDEVLSVKTMIYLLPHMQQPLSQTVLNRIRLLDVAACCRTWKKSLEALNQLFKPLLEADLSKTKIHPNDYGKYNRIIDLEPAVLDCVERRLQLLQRFLLTPPQVITGMELLSRLDAVVGLSYQSLQGKIKSPEDFYQIDPKAYVKHPKTGKVYSSASFQQIQASSINVASLQQSLNLQPSYFSAIDWSNLTEEQQRFTLQLLQSTAKAFEKKTPGFIELNLRGCTVLDEAELIKLLIQMPNLARLDIQGCEQFELKTVMNLLSTRLNESGIWLTYRYDVLAPRLVEIQFNTDSQQKKLRLQVDEIKRKKLNENVRFIQQLHLKVQLMVDKLLVALADKDKYVRGKAAEALGRFSGGLKLQPELIKPIVDKLCVALADKDRYVRGNAAAALGHLSAGLKYQPELIKTIIDKLSAVLADNNEYVRGNAAWALSHLSEGLKLQPALIKSIVDKLCAALVDKDRYVRRDAAEALGRFSGGLKLQPELIKPIVDKLCAALADNNPVFRHCAAEALGRLSEGLKLQPELIICVVDKLIAALADKNPDVRSKAAWALGHLSEGLKLQPELIKPIIDKLSAVLADNNEYVRGNAAAALGHLSAGLKPRSELIKLIIHKLNAVLADKDEYVRRDAAEALGRFSGGLKLQPELIKPIVDKLCVALADKDSHVRGNAAAALGHLSAGLKLQPELIKSIVDKLFAALVDKDGYVRGNAAEALGQLTKITPVIDLQTIEKIINFLLKDVHLKDEYGLHLKDGYHDKFALIRVLSSKNIYSQIEYWCGAEDKIETTLSTFDNQIAFHLFEQLDKPHQSMLACVNHQTSFWHQSYLQQKQMLAEEQSMALLQPGANQEPVDDPAAEIGTNYFKKFSF